LWPKISPISTVKIVAGDIIKQVGVYEEARKLFLLDAILLRLLGHNNRLDTV
jgi:hypothetical protein